MNERDLRYLLAVAECGTLQAAAERIRVTQPALTKCIARLEEQTGSTLFERRGRQTLPTEMGEIFIRRAKIILRNIDESRREMKHFANGQSGHIRLGVAATLTESLMPDVVARLSKDLPDITMELMVGMSDVLRDALRQNRVDLVLGPTSDAGEFDCLTISEDEVVVVASRDHPLAGKRVKLDDLRNFGWVLPPRSVALRIWLEHALEQLGLAPPRVQIEVNSLVSMPKIIARSHLLSFVSTRSLSKSEVELMRLQVDELVYRRTFGILSVKDGFLPAAARRFVDVVKSTVEAN